MSKLIELRLKKEALQKKMDAIEVELELVYHQMNIEMEKEYND